jgi:hypothetical protein
MSFNLLLLIDTPLRAGYSPCRQRLRKFSKLPALFDPTSSEAAFSRGALPEVDRSHPSGSFFIQTQPSQIQNTLSGAR